MRLSVKGHYAVRALLDLASQTNGPVRLQEISTRQQISLHYLEQLFRKFRTAKLVKSIRGPGSGYVLSRSPEAINIKEILESVGENINPARDVLPIPSSGFEVYNYEELPTMETPTKEFNKTKTYFNGLGIIMEDYLRTTTLKDLVVR